MPSTSVYTDRSPRPPIPGAPAPPCFFTVACSPYKARSIGNPHLYMLLADGVLLEPASARARATADDLEGALHE